MWKSNPKPSTRRASARWRGDFHALIDFHTGLFEWYERRCLLQEKVVNFCFQTGTLAIIGCLMTYMKGHLTLGDPEEMLVAKTAFTCFASILGGFAIASNMLSCLGATW